MLLLDKTRPFGEYHPPAHEPDCDRPAHYDQDGHMFDAHGRQIIPGKPLASATSKEQDIIGATDAGPLVSGRLAAEPQPADDPAPAPDLLSANDLIGMANSMSWPNFRSQAQRILGPGCPASKQQIIDALEKAIATFAKKQAKRPEPKGMIPVKEALGKVKQAVDAYQGDQDPPDTDEAPPPAPAAKTKGSVDLARWARGQQEYLFADVRKEIRKTYSKYIAGPEERKDAVDFLVSVGLIAADQVRRDV